MRCFAGRTLPGSVSSVHGISLMISESGRLITPFCRMLVVWLTESVSAAVAHDCSSRRRLQTVVRRRVADLDMIVFRVAQFVSALRDLIVQLPQHDHADVSRRLE